MRVAGEWGWRFLVLVAAVAVAGFVVVHLSLLFIAIFVALLLAALMQPGVLALRRLGLPRGLAAAVVFIGGLVALGLVSWLVGKALADGLGDIGTSVQEGIDRLRDWAATGPLQLSEAEVQRFIDNIRTSLEQNREQLTSGAIATATVAAEVVSGLLLALFAAFFFLYDGERIWAWVVRLFPREAEPRIHEAGLRAWRTLVGYVRGTVIVAFVDGFFIGLAVFLAGVPLAVPLGVLVFLGAFVPLVGATVTGAVAVVVALATEGLTAALIVLAAILAVQQLEGHILQPLVLGRLVQVHPLAVVLAVAGGALVAGIPGAVVAVPLVAVVNTVTGYLVRGAPERSAGP